MEVETSGVHDYLNDRSRIRSRVQRGERGFMAQSAGAHISTSRPRLGSIFYNDSQDVVALLKNPVHHNAFKHIDVPYHFFRDYVI